MKKIIRLNITFEQCLQIKNFIINNYIIDNKDSFTSIKINNDFKIEIEKLNDHSISFQINNHNLKNNWIVSGNDYPLISLIEENYIYHIIYDKNILYTINIPSHNGDYIVNFIQYMNKSIDINVPINKIQSIIENNNPTMKIEHIINLKKNYNQTDNIIQMFRRDFKEKQMKNGIIYYKKKKSISL